MVSAIREDAYDNDKSLSIDDGADELLRRWNVTEDADKPSKDDESGRDEDDTSEEDEADEADESEEEDDSEDTDDEDEDDSDDESDDKAKDKKARKFVEEDDSTYIKVKVDGKDHEVPVKDLKRLWGQEQALNRKSEETAVVRKHAEESGAKYVAGVAKLLELAQADYEPYSKVDFLLAAKELDAEELTALRGEAQKTYERVRFLEQELDNTIKEVEQYKHTERLKEAREANKVLSDPEKGIPGWGEKLYDELRTFAVGQGIPEAEVNMLTNPVAFKIMHKAMLYEKGQKALEKTKKVDKTPKKVIKTSANAEATRKVTNSKNKGAEERLRRSGDIEDAADVFLSRWS